MIVWIGALALMALALVPLSQTWALAANLGHGWAAPLLIGYLWWERWAERPALAGATAPSVIWIAWWIVLLGLAGPLRLLLTPYPLWPMAVIAYVGILATVALTLAGLMGGRAGVRWLGGPLVILLAALPWPGGIERISILPLREGIASLVAEISNLAGLPALASGTSVRLAGGWVGIEEACGGIRSLQAAVMTALFFSEWLRLGWARRLLLVLAGALAAIVGNFGRVLFLTWAAGHGELARWHDPAGWVALGFALIATGALGWQWRRRDDHTPFPAAPRSLSKIASFPRAVLVWGGLMVAMLAAIEGGTRWWYAHGAHRAAAVPQWTVRLPEGNPTFHREPLAETAREMLRPDRFVSASWVGRDLVQRNANYVVWDKGQVARSAPFLHNPTICLPYSGCELVEPLGVVEVSWAHGIIPFHAYVFRRMNENLLVAFTIWDPSRGRPLETTDDGWSGWWQRQWRDVMEARRDQSAQLLSFALVGEADRSHLGAELERLIYPSE